MAAETSYKARAAKPSIRERKLRTLFNLLDANMDGYITAKDYEAVANRMNSLQEVDAAQREKFHLGYGKDLFAVHLSDEAQDGKLDFASFYGALTKKSTAELQELNESISSLYFNAFDADCDGYINEKEFAKTYKVLGIGEQHAAVTFKALDTDEDGKISSHEYATAFKEFFNSEDETSKYNALYGPLADW